MVENNHPKHDYFCEFIPEEAMEHARAAREEMRKSIKAILPPEFLAHRQKARLEMLFAAREIINHTIDKLESQQKE